MFLRRKKYVCTSICWILSSPAAMRRCTHWWLGLKRRVWPTIATLPVCSCSRSTASASARLSASGISTWTCLPARRHCIACAAWICVGVQRITASTSRRARLSARSVVTCPTPNLRATSCVDASTRPTSETTSTPSIFASASRCLTPKAPAPARPILIVSIVDSLGVLENDVADGGIRRRHVIEAIDLARGRVQRATHDEPHHELDSLGARFTHIVEVRQLREAFGIGREPVKEARVELAVDEARARDLQLMRHATGAPDHHVEVASEGFDRLADRAAEVPAAVAGGRRG